MPNFFERKEKPAAPMTGTEGDAMGAAGGEGQEPGQGMFPPGFNPAMMNMEWIQKIQQAMQKLPRGQLIEMQALVKRATSGQDVSKEFATLSARFPKSIQDMLLGVNSEIQTAEAANAGTIDATAEKPGFFKKIFKK